MGKYDNGILGGFNGKIGNIVGSTWKGISYMRAVPGSRNKKVSDKQIIQRAKFMYASNFLQALQPVIQVGYRNKERCKTARNAAMSDFLNYTLIGQYPSFAVNFDRLMLSKGTLEVPSEYSVELSEGRAMVHWNVELQSEDNVDEDKLLAQMLENKVMLVTVANGCYPKYTLHKFRRRDGVGDIGLPNAPSGTEVHCYLAFAATDDSLRVSNSVHVGVVTVP